ncbi:MAG: MFS transporter [Jatrophihabitantaceae bacterium]
MVELERRDDASRPAAGRRRNRPGASSAAAVAVRRHGRGWPAVALVGAAFAIAMLGTTLPTPLYPLYSEQFGFGELVTTVVFASYAIGVTAGLLLFGHWSDQLGRRRMLLAGLALSGLSAVAYLLPAELGWLFVGRVLSGLSAGIFTGTATATILDLAPPSGQARASLLAAAVNMGGLGLGPVLAGLLSQYAPFPLRLCFVVDLVLVAVGIGCVLVVREPVSRAAAPRLRPRPLRVPVEIRAVFTRAAVAGFAGFAVLGLFSAVSPAFLGTVLRETNRALVGAVVLVLFAASVTGQLLSAQIGLDRALPAGCGALIAGVILVAASLSAHSLAWLVVGAIIAGFGQGMSFRAGLGSVAEASPPDQRGEITSTFFVMLYVGIAIPVIGEGALAGAFGLVTAGTVFAGLVAALAAVALVLVRRSS